MSPLGSRRLARKGAVQEAYRSPARESDAADNLSVPFKQNVAAKQRFPPTTDIPRSKRGQKDPEKTID